MPYRFVVRVILSPRYLLRYRSNGFGQIAQRASPPSPLVVKAKLGQAVSVREREAA